MHQVWSLGLQKCPKCWQHCSHQCPSPKNALWIPFLVLFLVLQNQLLQQRLRGEAVYFINLKFPTGGAKEKRQPAGENRETPPALRKMKLPFHILSRKETLWPLHFFFQPVTPKGNMKGTEVKLLTKAKQIYFSNFLWSFQVWSCWVFVILGFFLKASL